MSINFLSLHNTFKLKDEKEELKPHSFCETPKEKCTLGYCDENGCMNRKRFLVESEIESVNHPNHYGGKGNPLEVINIIESVIHTILSPSFNYDSKIYSRTFIM